MVSSCEKQPVESVIVNNSFEIVETQKIINYKGFEAQMPASFPAEIMEYTVDDLKEIVDGKRDSKNLRVGAKKTLEEVVSQIYAKYPSFDKFSAKEYKKFFPKMSENEIVENSEIVLGYVEKLMAYDVTKTFAEEGDGKVELNRKTNKNGRIGVFLRNVWTVITSCESYYYLAHLRMSFQGLCDAKDAAYNIQEVYYGQSSVGDDRGDALRHGVWTVLTGKYACQRYGTVQEARVVASGFATSHECFDYSEESCMDRKNNVLSANYYIENAERYNAGFLNYNTRVNKSDATIGQEIHGKGYVKAAKTNTAIQNADSGKLVFIVGL